MTEVRYINVDSLIGEAFGNAYSCVSASRRAKIDSYRFDKDKRLSLGAGLLLCSALDDAGLDADSEPTLSEYGKPYIDGLFYNLSHSGSLAVIAVSDGEVGVDVERIRTVDDLLIRRVCTDAEYRYLSSAADMPEAFFRFWTAKESVMKLYGCGLAMHPKSIEVDAGRCAKVNGERVYLHEYAVDGYGLTVASESDAFSPQLKEIKFRG